MAVFFFCKSGKLLGFGRRSFLLAIILVIIFLDLHISRQFLYLVRLGIAKKGEYIGCHFQCSRTVIPICIVSELDCSLILKCHQGFSNVVNVSL